MTKRLEHMKEALMCALESQVYNLGAADTEEMGEVVDMVKDLEEAIYYCTITEAMKGEKQEQKHYYDPSYMMYRDDRGGNNNPTGRNQYTSGNSNNNYYDHTGSWNRPYYDMESDWNMSRDHREGRSPMSRKMYMEAKEHKRDKTVQLRELEKYMQELSQDVVDMIQDSSPEEKQYLEKKITALASKIGQMK